MYVKMSHFKERWFKKGMIFRWPIFTGCGGGMQINHKTRIVLMLWSAHSRSVKNKIVFMHEK